VDPGLTTSSTCCAAALPADPSSPDIIDETLSLFRANCLFRNFEINGPADRLLIYLTLFVSECLAKIGASRIPPGPAEAKKTLTTLSLESFALPGDATFPLNSMYAAPANSMDSGASILTSRLLPCATRRPFELSC
jgi:actin related protein 2/3 complex subunit 3